jgi:stage IV sporulation protein FB
MLKSKEFRFQILNIPVKVDVFFFLVAAALGSQRGDLFLLLSWVAVVFVSVLVHELGHALVGRYYGHTPWIKLYAGGGLTFGVRDSSEHVVYWRGERVFYKLHNLFIEDLAIILAGPAAGFLLGGIVCGLRQSVFVSVLVWQVQVLVADLMWVNIGWGLLNLLPMLPLDGGNIMHTLVHKIRRYEDERLPLQISIGVGLVICVAAIMSGMLWGAMLSGWFTYQNYQKLQYKDMY